MLRKLLPYIVFYIHRLAALTWRIRIYESPSLIDDLKNKRCSVLAHWHGEQSGLVLTISRYNVTIMTSQSRDGELMTRFVELYGAKTVRGSSSKGAVGALKGMIRLSHDGYNPAISVDGPRGPFHSVKPGVFELSRVCRAKIYPGVVVASSAWRFARAWDRSFFPKPFAKVLIYWGEPVGPIKADDDCKSPELAKILLESFESTREKALKYIVDA